MNEDKTIDVMLRGYDTNEAELFKNMFGDMVKNFEEKVVAEKRIATDQQFLENHVKASMGYWFRNPNKELAREMGLIPYIVNFRTLSFEVPRQTGKTTTIEHLMTDDDMVICRTIKQENYRIGQNVNSTKRVAFGTTDSIFRGTVKRIGTIWCDECTIIPKPGESNLLTSLETAGMVTPETRIVILKTPV